MEYGFGTRGGFALVVFFGVVVPGVINYALSTNGYGTVGSVIWYLGYGQMALLLWYGWLRPLNLGGDPGTNTETE